MNSLIILFACSSVCFGDIIRTVYCKNHCSDYVAIPEHSMPLCAAEHLKMTDCGTVITCDWAEAEREKTRPVANSSDISCCYRTVIKEKGECAFLTEQEPSKQVVHTLLADHCAPLHILPWLLCILLLIMVILQAAYIMKIRHSGPAHQKVSQADDPVYLPPVLISRPLVNTQLLGHTNAMPE